MPFFKPDPRSPLQIPDPFRLATPPGQQGVYWIDSRLKRRRKIIITGLAAVTAVVLVYYLQLLVSRQDLGWQHHVVVLSALAVFIYAVRQWLAQARIRIGIAGNRLLVDDGLGHRASGKNAKVQYCGNLLLVNGMAAYLGTTRQPLYPKEEILNWIIPRMRLGIPISRWEALGHLWRQRHPIALIILAIAGYVIAANLVLRL